MDSDWLFYDNCPNFQRGWRFIRTADFLEWEATHKVELLDNRVHTEVDVVDGRALEALADLVVGGWDGA